MTQFLIDLISGEPHIFNIGVSGSTGSTGAVVYNNANLTPNSLGGIPAGSTFSNKTMQEMWNALLYPTMNPSLIAPNNGFSLPQNGLHIIGKVIPVLNFTSTFSRGTISPAYGTSGFRSGLATSYNFIGNGLPATSPNNTQIISNYTVLNGVQSWGNTVSYAAGEQPKNSVGANYGSALVAGTTSPSKTVSITGVYPYYGTSVNLLTRTEQTLALHNAEHWDVNMAGGENVTDKQTAWFPYLFNTITGIQQYTAIGGWAWIGGTKANSLATFIKTSTQIAINGNNIDYWVYTHVGAFVGTRPLKFYTT